MRTFDNQKQMRITIRLCMLLLCVTLPAAAQKKNGKIAKTSTSIETAGQKLFKSMLPATAKVMFVDSMVVSKSQFLRCLPTNNETGKITVKGSGIGHDGTMLTQYENEFGDRRIFADGDITATMLYSQTLLGKQWSQPQPLPGLDDKEYVHPCYPFLSSDGVTLFFAAKGANSIGGYDIFMTTYDNDNGQWYTPQNYGLPFNSPANEYLLAIDDIDTLGWLVSDRYQAPDSVCIYTFVPAYPRKDFHEDNLSEAQLTHFANIASIRDTWKFGDRKAALQRLAATMSKGQKTATAGKPLFVVNDHTVATEATQLKYPESRKLYAQWLEIVSLSKQTATKLDAYRKQFADSPAVRQKLRPEIILLEKEQQQQNRDIEILEKNIRKLENHN